MGCRVNPAQKRQQGSGDRARWSRTYSASVSSRPTTEVKEEERAGGREEWRRGDDREEGKRRSRGGGNCWYPGNEEKGGHMR